MTISLVDDTYDQKAYDTRVYHPMQSFRWGQAREKMGTQVVRLTDGKDNFQLTIHPLIFGFKLGYLPRSITPSSAVLKFLTEWGIKNKIIFIKIEPYTEKSAKQTVNVLLRKSPHPLFPAWTQMLDIDKSEEELLKNMHAKTRYNIRLAQKKGVIIKEESNEKGFKIFSQLYFETCRRQKYHGHNVTYHKTIWENLKNDISHIMIAYYNDIPLAAYELFFFKDRLYYVYGGTSMLHRNVMAANLLMWESIKFGKKIGATKFDMWGSLPPNYDSNHDWAGFTRFKEGYGCKFVEMVGSFDLVINPLLYTFYNISYKIRSLILKIK